MKHIASKLSLIAAAATLLVACDRSNNNQAGPTPTPTPSPISQPTHAPPDASAASPAEKKLADAFAKVWDLLIKARDGEKSLVDWSSSDGDLNSPDPKPSQKFNHALRILVGEQTKTTTFAPSYASRYELILELLEKQQPQFGKKWRDKAFDPVLLRYGYGPMIGQWGSDPLPDDQGPLTDGSMSLEEANKTVVEFCLRMEREYFQPGLKTLEVQKQISEHAGPECDRCLIEVFHVSPEQWMAGQGPADLDLPAALRKVLLRYHPEIAGPAADFFADRLNHDVSYAQDDIKRQLTTIAKAEQSFVERMFATDGGYWTADLAGLYRFKPNDEPVNLIDPELARLDTHPANLANEAPLPPAGPVNESNLAVFALAAVHGADGKALDAHHYAFCAWPLGYGRIGRQTYLLIDPGKVFVKDTDGKPIDRLPADLDADGWTTIDFNGAVAVPVSGLADPDPIVRIKSLNRLMGVENENDAPPSDLAARQISPAAAKSLAAMLADSDKFVRARACQVARFFGKPAISQAAPILLHALSSDDAEMRADAMRAVKDLKIQSPEIATALATLASSNEPAERDGALDALAIQKLDDDATTQLIAIAGKAVNADNPGNINGAIRFLGSRGPLASDYADKLKEIGSTPDPDGGPYPQEDAAEAYFHISSDASVYAAILIAMLKSEGFDRQLLFKLAALGPPAVEALPDLRKLLADPGYEIDRAVIAYPIGRISGNLKETVTILIPMLKDGGQMFDALDVLEKLGPDAVAALDALQEQATKATSLEKEHFQRTIAAINGHPMEDN